MDKGNLKLTLTPAAERAVRGGHPWVFADRVKSQNRAGVAGELAVMYDRENRFLAIGLYDPDSLIRVRVLCAGTPMLIDDSWFREQIGAAVARRAGLFIESETSGYRCVNGESDGLPGLVIDRYADVAVAKLYTAAWLPFVVNGRLRQWVSHCCGTSGLVLRLSRNIQRAAALLGFEDGDVLAGEANEVAVVQFRENGARFEAEPVRGQKTGFFLDQRDNRMRVRELARGGDVLNLFSHAGGFSVNAAMGGARSATDLDISSHALAAARRNMEINRRLPAVNQCRHETVQADAFVWLADHCRDKAARGRSYDIVVIDPPSLAKRQSECDRALDAYQRLAGLGLQLLRDGGLLVAASCSAHVSADAFFRAIRDVALRHRRGGAQQAKTHHAADHPAAIPEARYLKCLFWRLR